jgi:hypothetical protein
MVNTQRVQKYTNYLHLFLKYSLSVTYSCSITQCFFHNKNKKSKLKSLRLIKIGEYKEMKTLAAAMNQKNKRVDTEN